MTAHVHVRDVSKTFRTRKQTVRAVQSMSFTVPRGEFVSLLGPSGCGKSTMLSIIAGLCPTTSGEVLVDNRPLSGPNTSAGVVFQSDLLLEWRTALDNVLLQFDLRGIKPTRQQVQHARSLMGMVGVHDFASAHPHQMSGGMRQRVAICRALVHDPPLLLMDEPFGALDAITRERINLDLARITAEEGKTTIFVTHSIEEAVFQSDRILIMSSHPGRLAGEVTVPIPRPRRQWPSGASEFDMYSLKVRAILDGVGAYAP